MRWLLHDITARKQAEAERDVLLIRAEEARSTAEAAVRTRDQFLSSFIRVIRNQRDFLSGEQGIYLTFAFLERVIEELTPLDNHQLRDATSQVRAEGGTQLAW